MAWLSGWDYRKSHTLNGSTAGAQTNYQLQITVHYGSGSDSGADVYCDSKCETDFDDIRFTKSDGSTLLDYWLQEKTDSDNAIFWVEVDSIPASPDTVDIYVYYGKSGASSTSNGKNTFKWFYDFGSDESSDWTNDSGTWTWDTGNSRLESTGSGTRKTRITGASSTTDAFDGRYLINGDNYHVGFIFGVQDGSNLYYARLHIFEDEIQLYKKVSDSWTKLSGVALTLNKDIWYTLKVEWISASSIKVYVDGTLKITQTTNLEAWTTGGIGFRDNSDSSSTEGQHDYIRVREFCDPEPAHSTWGGEESPVSSGSADLSANVTIQNKAQADLSANVTIRNKSQADLSGSVTIQNKSQNDLSANVTIQNKAQFDLSANVTIRNKGQYDLSASATIQNKGSYDLSANTTIQNKAQADLSANFTISGIQSGQADLSSNVTIQNKGTANLSANFFIGTGMGGYIKLADAIVHKIVVSSLTHNIVVDSQVHTIKVSSEPL